MLGVGRREMVTRMFSPQGLPLLSGRSLWLDSLLASDLRGVFLRRSWMEKPLGYSSGSLSSNLAEMSLT